MTKEKRHKNWEFIAYSESLKPNWLSILTAKKYRGYVSPEHCNDEWTAEDEAVNSEHKAGTLKKPHYHIIICLADAVANSNRIINDIIIPISKTDQANKYAEYVGDMMASVRYLVHEDSPGKYHYDKKDIICLGGKTIDSYFTSKDYLYTWDRLENLILDNSYCTMREILNHLKRCNMYDELDLFRHNTYYFKTLAQENKEDYTRYIMTQHIAVDEDK